MRTHYVIVAIVAAGFCAGCAPQGGGSLKDPASRVKAMSQLATTPEQKRLWNEAAAGARAAGLDTMPVVDRAVEVRKQVQVPDKGVQSLASELPKSLISGVLVLSAPQIKGNAFTGTARVTRIDGEKVDLEIGPKLTFGLQVRVRGGALKVETGETGRMEYRAGNSVFSRQMILGVLFEKGDGFLTVLEGGSKPVTVQVPTFKLTATQIGNPEKDTMKVEVRVGGSRQMLTQGQIYSFKEEHLVIGLVGSTAYTGDKAFAVEGDPYSINLIAWSDL
jgi:hypothetical protein